MSSTLKDAQEDRLSSGTPPAEPVTAKDTSLKHIDSGKAKNKTTYKVLKVTGSARNFTLVGTVAASNDDSAATAAAEEWGEGEYVLIPPSSWHQHSRQQTTITKWLKG